MSDISNRGFHLERSISVGHLITTVVIGVSALMYVTKMEARLDVHDSRLSAAEQRLDRERIQTDAAMAEIRATLRRLDDKMDRLLTKAEPR